MILLNKDIIKRELKQIGFDKPLQLYLFDSLDSTNQFLKIQTATKQLQVCCAEEQTAGKGRLGKNWSSPFGKNIYCSFGFSFQGKLKTLSTLSLVIALATLSGLKKRQMAEELYVKWPNDIIWQNKKLAGILIETLSCPRQDNYWVIIGIGINVNAKPRLENYSSCSLLDIEPWNQQEEIDRNPIISKLICEVAHALEAFQKSGFSSFHQSWDQVDYLKNQWLKLKNAQTEIEGRACGINNQGELCIKDEEGKLHYFSSGDTSIGQKGYRL